MFAYLARILEAEGFGVIGFAGAYISFFLLIANFGTDTIAAREIAKKQGNLSGFSSAINEIFSARIILTFVILLFFFVILLLIPVDKNTKTIFAIFSLNILTNAVTVNWFFQGTEKMQFISWRQISSGFLSLILVFLLIHNSDDIFSAALIISGINLLTSVFFLRYFIKYSGKISFKINFGRFKEIILHSYPVAISAFMIGIYYHLDMVMLGYMKPLADTGIYNASFKIFAAAIIPFNLISQAVFPALSKTGISRSKEFFRLIKSYAFMLITSGVIISLLLFLFSEEIIVFFFGMDYIAASVPLSILAINTLIISANIFFGSPLIAWGEQKRYSIVISFGALSNVVLNFWLIPQYSFVGAAFATLLSEIIVFTGLIFLHFFILKIRLA